MGTVETPHHVPRTVQLNHGTNGWVMVTHTFTVFNAKVVCSLEINLSPSSQVFLCQKNTNDDKIQWQIYLLWHTTVEHIWILLGHISVSTHTTKLLVTKGTYQSTPGHQKDIAWHLSTDGRI